MTKMVTAYIGVLMLVMHFSSQVQALGNNTTMNTPTMTPTMMAGYNMTTVNVNSTMSNSTAQGASVSLQSSAITLLIPVALAGSLLQGRL